MFRKTAWLLAVLWFVFNADAQMNGLPATYELPGETVYPEGIAYDPASGFFYVSSTTDGTIFRGNIQTGEVSIFSPGGSDGRVTAIGLAVDTFGRLWVARGPSGMIFAYDSETAGLIGSFQTPETEATFLNDVIVTPDGDAYITDSLRPILFKVPASAEGVGELEPWLYRIDTQTQEVIEIDLAGGTLTNGGLVLDGPMLYVVRNVQHEIPVVEVSEDFSSGTLITSFSDPSFGFQTTAAKVSDHLLVVNARFDKRATGDPDLPFTVSRVAVPAREAD